MLDLGTASKVALFLAVPTTSLLLYWLLRRPDDEEDDCGGQRRVATSRQTCIELRIPQRMVGAIIGRQGSVIRQIQRETKARVQFLDQGRQDAGGGGERLLQVRGTPSSAQEAELLIRKIMAELPQTVKENVPVPASAIGRIIGRGGETISSIQSTSRCMLQIGRDPDPHCFQGTRLVSLIGTPDQIDLAKGMIQEVLAEEEKFRAKAAVVEATREHRPQSRREVSLPLTAGSGDWEDVLGDSSSTNAAAWPTSSGRNFLDVYVSSLESPARFWVQILSHATLELENFVEKMTDFYSHDPSSQDDVVSAVAPGDVVAAPFAHDSCWYRARVVGVSGEQAALFYVDYGDSGTVPLTDLRTLRSDFLAPPHLAVECRLADVLPAGEEWSEEAIDAFDELSKNAQWKAMKVKTVRYASSPAGMVPCVRMLDVQDQQVVDVGEELVKRGFAVAEPREDNSSKDKEV